jgi:hypothetical protein
MSIIDLVCLLILGLSVLNGNRLGALRLTWSIVRLVIAYVAAYALAPRVGALLHGTLVEVELFATILGGLIVFWGVLLLLELVAALVRYSHKARRRGEPGKSKSKVDQAVGGLIGSIVGLVLVVILCWLYQLVLGSDWGTSLPGTSTSKAVRFSETVVRHCSEVILTRTLDEPETAERVARFISTPQKTTIALKEVAASPRIQKLSQSTSFRDDLLSGEKERILANPDFQSVVEDERLLKHLARAGILSEAEIGARSRDEMAEELARVGTRMGELLHDPVVQADIEALRAEGLLELDKVFELMLDERFQKLLNRVTVKN